MEILISIGVFLFTVLLVYAAYFIIISIYRPEKRKAHRRLRRLSLSTHRNEAIDILKKKTLSEIPWLNQVLLKISFLPRIERFLAQADTPHPLGVFVLLAGFIFSAGLMLGMIAGLNPLAVALPSLFPASTPFLYLVLKRKKRMEKFERQLPEALDMIARALRAGHAFSGGLKLVAEEFGDPVGTEFGMIVDEINFGVSVPEALNNLTQRVACEDLKYFAVSAIIQRETGGNLVEILENLARLIRERFRFHGRVRALSAEGKLSAVVLVAIPFFIAGLFSIVRPEYIGILFTDDIGKVLVPAVAVLMGVGIYTMKKMISIKV